MLTTAVVSAARIALGVLVGQNAARCVQNGLRYDVFGCDQLDLVALPTQLVGNRIGNFRVRLSDMRREETARVACPTMSLSVHCPLPKILGLSGRTLVGQKGGIDARNGACDLDVRQSEVSGHQFDKAIHTFDGVARNHGARRR